MLDRKRDLFLKREYYVYIISRERICFKKSNVYEKQTENPNLCFCSDRDLPKVSYALSKCCATELHPQSKKGLRMSLLNSVGQGDR